MPPRRERETPDERAARIEQIRRQIADGTYDTDERLEMALERMVERCEAVARNCRIHWSR